MVMALCGSCGSDDGAAAGSTGSGPTPTPSPTSIGAAITTSVASGALPNLDTGASVTGTDVNTNGIRDDIDTYINSLSDSDSGKSALRQNAVAVQSSLTVNTSDANAVATAAQKVTASAQCVHAQYPAEQASEKLNQIEKYTVNTKDRFIAYANFNSALNGNVGIIGEGSGCGQ